jgi:ribosome-associated protein
MVKKIQDSAARQKALRVVEFVKEKQAREPVILDVGSITNLCDYFVICSAETGVQARAIYEEVSHRCRLDGVKVHHWSADENNTWIMVDLFDVVVHIFTEDARAHYSLEQLWQQAPRVKPVLKRVRAAVRKKPALRKR